MNIVCRSCGGAHFTKDCTEKPAVSASAPMPQQNSAPRQYNNNGGRGAGGEQEGKSTYSSSRQFGERGGEEGRNNNNNNFAGYNKNSNYSNYNNNNNGGGGGGGFNNNNNNNNNGGGGSGYRNNNYSNNGNFPSGNRNFGGGQQNDGRGSGGRYQTKEIVLPAQSSIGLVIGKKGANISRLKTDSKCFIDINHETATVTVKGLPEGIRHVEEWIAEILTKYPPQVGQPPAMAETAPETE